MPSWQARAMRLSAGQVTSLARRARGGGEPTEEDVPKLRAVFDQVATRQRLAGDVEVHGMELGGRLTERVTTSQTAPGRNVLWLHGGAFILCSPATHRGIAGRVSRRARATVYVPSYRLAPEHPYPAAFEDVLAAWDELTEEVDPSRIVIGGDSAGGGLTMQLLVHLRDQGRPMPACAVLLSPWVDLSGSGPTMWERNDYDWMLPAEHMHLAAEAYAGDLPLTDPRVSPLFAELHGLPPLLVHVGTDEIVHDDGVRLVAKAKRAGVDASVGVWDGMFHVFHAFPVPEARRAWREIGGFIGRHLRD